MTDAARAYLPASVVVRWLNERALDCGVLSLANESGSGVVNRTSESSGLEGGASSAQGSESVGSRNGELVGPGALGHVPSDEGS